MVLFIICKYFVPVCTCAWRMILQWCMCSHMWRLTVVWSQIKLHCEINSYEFQIFSTRMSCFITILWLFFTHAATKFFPILSHFLSLLKRKMKSILVSIILIVTFDFTFRILTHISSESNSDVFVISNDLMIV